MSKAVLLVLVIAFIAATPGIMEAYLAWQSYPETRAYIVGWYAALLIVAILAATQLDGKGAL